jgi:hypothetical protein
MTMATSGEIEWPEGKGAMAVMDGTGDTKVVWDKNNRDEVDTARSSFDKLRAKGYLAYSVKKNGDPDVQIHTFDPNAERIILSPPLQGG